MLPNQTAQTTQADHADQSPKKRPDQDTSNLNYPQLINLLIDKLNKVNKLAEHCKKSTIQLRYCPMNERWNFPGTAEELNNIIEMIKESHNKLWDEILECQKIQIQHAIKNARVNFELASALESLADLMMSNLRQRWFPPYSKESAELALKTLRPLSAVLQLSTDINKERILSKIQRILSHIESSNFRSDRSPHPLVVAALKTLIDHYIKNHRFNLAVLATHCSVICLGVPKHLLNSDYTAILRAHRNYHAYSIVSFDKESIPYLTVELLKYYRERKIPLNFLDLSQLPKIFFEHYLKCSPFKDSNFLNVLKVQHLCLPLDNLILSQTLKIICQAHSLVSLTLVQSGTYHFDHKSINTMLVEIVNKNTKLLETLKKDTNITKIQQITIIDPQNPSPLIAQFNLDPDNHTADEPLLPFTPGKIPGMDQMSIHIPGAPPTGLPSAKTLCFDPLPYLPSQGLSGQSITPPATPSPQAGGWHESEWEEDKPKTEEPKAKVARYR